MYHVIIQTKLNHINYSPLFTISFLDDTGDRVSSGFVIFLNKYVKRSPLIDFLSL